MSLRSNPGGSKRWNHFHTALELAIQRSAHKWNFEDFADCFTTYVEEDRDGAMQAFNQVAQYIESTSKQDMDNLFQGYILQDNIEILDTLVREAKARKAAGDLGKDVWTENVRSHSAVCGRKMPILQSQAERLRVSLAQAENRALISELNNQIKVKDALQTRVERIVDKVEETYDVWERVPMEELHTWTAQIAETTRPTLRS